MLCRRCHVSFSLIQGCFFPFSHLAGCDHWQKVLFEYLHVLETTCRESSCRKLHTHAHRPTSEKAYDVTSAAPCQGKRKSFLYKCLCRTDKVPPSPSGFPSLLAERKIQDIWSKSNSFRCLFQYPVFSWVFGRLSNDLWLHFLLILNMTMCIVFP